MTPEDRQRFIDAFAFALDVHARQQRKGRAVPYSSHLLQVAGRVQESGGDLDQSIAALLHDAIEDSEHVSYELIYEEFGESVAEIVRDCTDTLPGEHPKQKRPWMQRKTEYLEHLKSAPDRSLLVTLCDKCHNLSSTLMDIQDRGFQHMDHFNSTPEQQLWYFESILEITRYRIPTRLQREFQELVSRFREILASAK
ncbi:MAG: HD domain-containing protein [bacterium]|nr:HD domain-containing protein [bacterium]